MRRAPSGFTLIELLIVISIIGLLAAVLLPAVFGSQDAANAAADSAQLRTHYQWLTMYQSKHKGGLPSQGGHKFVLATWTSGIVDHKEENFDKYFTPGSTRDNDPDYRQRREQIERGEDPWPDLKSTTSLDTTYAGRAKEHLKTSTQSASEAWMANDNEGIWNLRDGTVNVLFADGNVRSYSYQDLTNRFSLGKFDKDKPVETWGPNSPIPECTKLEN